MNKPSPSTKGCEASAPVPCSALERLASALDIPADDLREFAWNIAREKKYAAAMEKVRLIRERNTAILPTGEIVARGTPGSMDYNSPPNAAAQAPLPKTKP